MATGAFEDRYLFLGEVIKRHRSGQAKPVSPVFFLPERLGMKGDYIVNILVSLSHLRRGTKKTVSGNGWLVGW